MTAPAGMIARPFTPVAGFQSPMNGVCHKIHTRKEPGDLGTAKLGETIDKLASDILHS